MSVSFSIVIPVYNKEDYLRQTIQSVLDQTHTDYELILVNDGSTDGSQQLIESFRNDVRIQFYSQKNQGVSAARNLGIQKATKDYIAFLDADDLWHTNYLETMATVITEYTDHCVFGAAQLLWKNDKKVEKYYEVPIPKGSTAAVDLFEASTRATVLHTSSAIIKKEVFTQVGTFNTELVRGEDTELWTRIGLKYPVVFTYQYLVTYRHLQQSLSRSGEDFKGHFNPDQFSKEEIDRPALKAFMDMNRFALAIKARAWNKPAAFSMYSNGIDPANLNRKQGFLLALPAWLLRMFLNFKDWLDRKGVNLSPYS